MDSTNQFSFCFRLDGASENVFNEIIASETTDPCTSSRYVVCIILESFSINQMLLPKARAGAGDHC